MADESTPVVQDTASERPVSPAQKEELNMEVVADAPPKPESNSVVVGESGNTNKGSDAVQHEPNPTPAPSTQDIEMKDAVDTDPSATVNTETASETVKESSANAPATPATGKKTNGNTSNKKKSAGVPEHKSKKLNKKKSKVELRLNCQPGELYLARMKGHAPWPSIICDEEILPDSLLNTRPVTTAQADGTFKRADYAPGGKRENERTYPIMFLHTNEFAWLPNTDLTLITPEDCKNVEEKGKAKSLLAAYGVASEDHDLEYFKTMLAEHQAAVQEDLDRQAEKEAERSAAKAAKAEKSGRRKSTTAVEKDDDDDKMDIDEDGNTQKPQSKKRKKVNDLEDETEEKPAKAPKLKLNGPKTPSTDKKAPAKSKSSSKKVAAKKDSDEEMEDEPAVEATPLSAAEIKEKKEKEIRYYRHKLQRGLLSRDDAPSDEEVAHASGYLGKLETYPGLEGDIIRSTKIHKVLRAMIRLPSIPKDETYNLKKRAIELLQKWTSILGGDGGAEGATEGNIEATAAASTNADAGNTSETIEKKSEVPAEAPATTNGQDEVKAITGSEHKVNGTTEKEAQEIKGEASKSAESATTSNGIEKSAHPESQSATTSETAKGEEKLVETAEASS